MPRDDGKPAMMQSEGNSLSGSVFGEVVARGVVKRMLDRYLKTAFQ